MRGSSSSSPPAVRPAPADWYTGTLYKVLGAAAWSAPERRWAFSHLLIHDKDAGIVSAGSWETVDIAPVDADGSRADTEVLIDARSKEYVRLVPAPPSAYTLRVVAESEDGRRLAISHWNKFHKGVLAAALVRERPRLGGIRSLLSWAEGAEIRLEQVAERALDLVVPPTS